jgi:hypothetical protein
MHRGGPARIRLPRERTDPLSTNLPAYGSAESYARILQHTRPGFLEVSALAVVEIIAADRYDADDLRLERIQNVVAAVAMVRNAPSADELGLNYTRADDDAEDPTQPGPREPLHTGGMTEGGLVDESDGHRRPGAV